MRGRFAIEAGGCELAADGGCDTGDVAEDALLPLDREMCQVFEVLFEEQDAPARATLVVSQDGVGLAQLDEARAGAIPHECLGFFSQISHDMPSPFRTASWWG
jgi:hypothetical protein